MRAAVAAVVGLAWAAGAYADPAVSPGEAKPLRGAKAAPLIAATPTHPDVALRLIIEHLTVRVLREDRPFTRFFWAGATPAKRFAEDWTNWRAYLQTVNSDPDIVFPVEVKGSNGLLWAIDLRDPRWTIEGFSAVARRDFVFREPHVDSALAEQVRQLIGIKQDPETFHAEAVVPMHWFLRGVMDAEGTQRADYYDLLYSVERFGADAGTVANPVVVAPAVIPPEPERPKGKPWAGGVWPADGLYYPPGAFTHIPRAEMDAYEQALERWKEIKKSAVLKPPAALEILGQGNVVKAKVVKDFPANLDQYEERWGTKANADYLKQQKVFVNNGEVVAGSKSDPKRGSYVSYQDRVIRFADGQFANGGFGMSTQDFLRTSLKKNPSAFPLEAALGQLQEDAGEHLTTLPNGFQAALLTGPAGDGRKRVEFGDARLVHNSLDRDKDVVVKTQFSCVICHAPQDGILAPSNRKVGERLTKGIELFVRGKENQKTVRTFFHDWEWKLEVGRIAYRRGLSRATVSAAFPNGWTGEEWARATVSFRDWYDAPLTLDQAAAELGYPRLVVLIACLFDPSGDAADLFLDAGVSRTVFDDELKQRLTFIIAALRDAESPDPLFALFFPELVRQAEAKAKK